MSRKARRTAPERITRRKKLTEWASLLLLVLSFALLALTLWLRAAPLHPERSAERFQESVDAGMEKLDKAMAEMLSTGTLSEDLSREMVVYAYRNDTLVAWRNQFRLFNDGIADPGGFQMSQPRLRRSPSMPLRQVRETPSFINFGPRWYIIQSRTERNWTVIGGLLVQDTQVEWDGGISPALYHDGTFSVQPLDYGSGYEIRAGGTPVLSLIPDAQVAHRRSLTWPLWLALGLNILGSVLYLSVRRNLRRFLLVATSHSIILVAIYQLCRNVGDASMLFSPVTYAGRTLIYSLGIWLIINLYLLFVAVLVYMVRRVFFRWAMRRRQALRAALLAGIGLLWIAVLALLIHHSFIDILINSGIFLELAKFQGLTSTSFLVYASLLGLIASIPLVAQLLRPAGRLFLHRRIDLLRRWPRIIFVALAATYLVVTSSVMGQLKEQMMVGSCAGRLAMDRDISLEPRLLRIERNIQRDEVLAQLVYGTGDNNEAIIQRLRDYLLRTIAQNYDIAVFRFNEYEGTDPSLRMVIDQWVGPGQPIAEQSAFLFSTDGRGRSRYAGVFVYPSDTTGDTQLIVCIEAKSNKEDRGYLSLLGIPSQGAVALPEIYSYARYRLGELITQQGTITYPTLLPDRYKDRVPEGESFIDQRSGVTHFVHHVSPEEVVVISRKRISLMNYFFAVFLLALVLECVFALLRPHREGTPRLERHYFHTRIQTLLYVSLTVFVLVVGGFSAYFVGSRARNDNRAQMIAKIQAVQDQLQDKMRYYPSLSEVAPSELALMIEETGDALRTDLTLYSAEGKMLRSTTPDLYRQMLLGTRVNDVAYREIRDGNEPNSIVSESIRGRSFDAVYAPLRNATGMLVGFVSTPFVGNRSRFPADSVNYVISILSIFLLLMLLVRAFLRYFLDRMFRPISDLGEKMERTDINHLEPLVYERDDEIATLVGAYNRMVEVMSDSTRKLAQAERDRAWSEMARQVAHEIKNPLTPIKLRLQMLIRMKESGNPAWTEKFDEVAGVVLEHIDILADTASQFSTFAKLYSEDPVEFDLDTMIQEEISMFDARENVSFSYYGLEGTRVTGPKPQLTRVIVNLLTNAVQAVEGQEKGEVLVSLRKAAQEGFYDIVVEDNGPGVREEHLDKLFTPNFTTKNRGTGLGLAICRNIIERCGGEITYSRSFTLGGACFTIHYPK